MGLRAKLSGIVSWSGGRSVKTVVVHECGIGSRVQLGSLEVRRRNSYCPGEEEGRPATASVGEACIRNVADKGNTADFGRHMASAAAVGSQISGDVVTEGCADGVSMFAAQTEKA